MSVGSPPKKSTSETKSGEGISYSIEDFEASIEDLWDLIGGKHKVTSADIWQVLFSKKNLKTVFFSKIHPRGGQGADRMNVEAFAKNLETHIDIIYGKSLRGSYEYTPYLEQLKLKSKGRAPRVLAIPTVRDRLVLKILTDFMHDRFREILSKDLPNTIIKKIKKHVLEDRDPIRYIKLDISDFYSSICHDKLFAKIRERENYIPFVYLIRRAIRNPTLPLNYKKKDRKIKSSKGVPQGLAVSNVLAEIYISSFDAAVKNECHFYYRFVDDVFILCDKTQIKKIWAAIDCELKELGLKLNKKKSTRKNTAKKIDNPIEYLGYTFHEKKVSVRDASRDRFLHSIISKITKYRHGKWGLKIVDPSRRKIAFIESLNERITGAIDEQKRYGWAFFFSEINDLELLHQIDRIIASVLKRLEDFSAEDLRSVKSVVRTHYEVNFSPKRGYIHNYNEYRTVYQKLQFLIKRGYIAPSETANYTDDAIEKMYNQVKHQNLLKLDRDVARFS